MATFNHLELIEVRIWNRRVGAVAWDQNLGSYVFEYDQKWVRDGVQLAPIKMPTRITNSVNAGIRLFHFGELDESTFKHLPGMLADALPDRFGNQLIDAWMASRGYRPEQISTLDRLAYMSKRGMGALEFRPSRGGKPIASSVPIVMVSLVEQARRAFQGKLEENDHASKALNQLISVGTSAGGARAKAVLGWNPQTDEIVAGQFDLDDGFEHWLLKFDGVGADNTLGPSQQYGRIEYAYYRMATLAGIEMQPSRLFHEAERAHFMTKRFDRDGNKKIHLQSLCALQHMSYNFTKVHAYESLFLTARELGLGDAAMTQLFVRMAFNVAARNQDDHTKNFAFLMREGGSWELAPAYDVTFAMDLDNHWLSSHQMSVAGKFDGIVRDDLRKVADRFSIAGTTAAIDSVNAALAAWPTVAAEAAIKETEVKRIAGLHQPL